MTEQTVVVFFFKKRFAAEQKGTQFSVCFIKCVVQYVSGCRANDIIECIPLFFSLLLLLTPPLSDGLPLLLLGCRGHAAHSRGDYALPSSGFDFLRSRPMHNKQCQVRGYPRVFGKCKLFPALIRWVDFVCFPTSSSSCICRWCQNGQYRTVARSASSYCCQLG